MFAFSLNDGEGLLLVEIGGFIEPSDATRYNDEFAGWIVKARDRFGAAKVLIDARESRPQTADAVDAFEDPGAMVRDGQERVAIVVASSLVKMQVRRSLNTTNAAAFLSMDAARIWLGAI